MFVSVSVLDCWLLVTWDVTSVGVLFFVLDGCLCGYDFIWI